VGRMDIEPGESHASYQGSAAASHPVGTAQQIDLN
jgi:hypothetical protein